MSCLCDLEHQWCEYLAFGATARVGGYTNPRGDYKIKLKGAVQHDIGDHMVFILLWCW